ncbi:hypothetical protein C440_10478 [Haloferax mucosum ATCC BAA-1512]|uniref:Uncharacterized protein n=1 Tax=Haloferax mucosum ATCC BAA-1512 TaxID=662479 RepID=M0IF32_9EURY|nr:hypothetical protein [Haloferax mucosum]ELZ94039.1 hypothetical protein C440_10478 [Haloferax mucosum ATCC BAA-1512]
MHHLRYLEPLYDVVFDKRGSFQIRSWLPPVYPRNLPYVIDQWGIFFWLVPIAGITWLGLEPFAGGLGFTALPALVLIGTKHYLILQTWEANGTYANASARTIRRSRELFYLTVITCFAVWGFSTTEPSPAHVTASTTIWCLPKFLFECRESGFGPWPLTFDPAIDDEDDELSLTVTEPRRVFRNEWRVVRDWAIYEGLSYAVLVVPYLGSLLALVGLFVYGSLRTAFVGFGIATLVSPLATVSLALLVFSWGYAHEEYRIYDDKLVAYDTRLAEPQWVVPIEDVESVAVGDDPLGSIFGLFNPLPFTKYPVRIEPRDGDERRLRALVDPEGFVRELRRVREPRTRPETG